MALPISCSDQGGDYLNNATWFCVAPHATAPNAAMLLQDPLHREMDLTSPLPQHPPLQDLFEGSTGCHTWDAGFLLAEYVMSHPEEFRGARVGSAALTPLPLSLLRAPALKPTQPT